MAKSSSIRTALLAAASLSAASFMAQVHASPADISVVSIEHVGVSPDHADEAATVPKKSNKIAFAAIAAGLLAAIIKIFGVRRLLLAIGETGPVVINAARVAADAPIRAARAMGSSLASPVKFALLVASLGLFAFMGIGLLDIEWTAGLAVGGAMTVLTWFGFTKLRSKPALRRAKIAPQTTVGRH